ncbi:MAG TPA: YqgE/AlgH family protein [Stellaceae bacterium]|jgi:putative transcriptional regulator|nr:YqgE/AlgH family protein [Stellaceae bacterium]
MAIGRAAAAGLGLLVAVLGLAAVEPMPVTPDVPGPGSPPPENAAPADPPAGTLLIASAHIQDPRFYHAVILLLRHDQGGAFGIVVNHVVAKQTIAGLLAATGDQDNTVVGTISVLSGGPVQPQRGFLVHSADYRIAATLAVDGKVAMTASREALKDIGHHKGPRKYFFAFGYAGWGAGQLEAEIARKDWFTTPEDGALVFDDDRAKVWDEALARRGRDL